MVAVALDTNVAIALLNNEAWVAETLRPYTTLLLPVIVCGELLFGARNSARQVQNEANVRELIRRAQVLDLTTEVAESYAAIRLHLKQQGRPIPENDMWIAAICAVHDVPLLSIDKHFQNIPGLIVR